MNLLTATDLAARLGTDEHRIGEWQRRYRWPHVKIGRAVRWTEDQAEEIVRRHVVAGQGITRTDGRTDRSASRRRSA